MLMEPSSNSILVQYTQQYAACSAMQCSAMHAYAILSSYPQSLVAFDSELLAVTRTTALYK
jgi:hypothetical protein